jgi:hypothetical protein
MKRAGSLLPRLVLALATLASSASAQPVAPPPLPPPSSPPDPKEPAVAPPGTEGAEAATDTPETPLSLPPRRGRRRPGRTATPKADVEPARPVEPPTSPLPRGTSKDEPDAAEAEREPAGPPSASGLRVSAGVKIAYVATSGFDSFASNDVLPSFSVDATYGVFTRGRLTLGAGLGWDAGGRSSDLRRLDSSLTTQRLSVPLEARFALTPTLWGVARVAPGATYAHASAKDAAAPEKLEDSSWAFSLDASVGTAFVLGGAGPAKKGPRFVLLPEVGYTFATSLALSPKPSRDDADVIGTDAPTRYPDLALSGFFWRATAGLVF